MSDRQDSYSSQEHVKAPNVLMTATNNFLHTMNHGFMTVNCGPGVDPFISIKFANLERAHAAHRALIALAMVARTATDTKSPQEHAKAPNVPLNEVVEHLRNVANRFAHGGPGQTFEISYAHLFRAADELERLARLSHALEQAIDHLVRLDAHVDGQGYRPSIRGTVALGRSVLSSQNGVTHD